MEKLTEILKDLEQGRISADNAEEQVLRLFSVSGNEVAVLPSNEMFIKFLDEELDKHREWAKDAKTKSEQEYHFRGCSSISYLKQMWLGKTDR
jgi:hypothetical protein